ncbi:MAG: homoserine kinase [Actinomycetota bacterium]
MGQAGVRVRVPATVANLGPGFDCLGVALGTYLELRVSRLSALDRAEIAGGDPSIPLAEDLTHIAFLRAFALAGKAAPPVRIEVVTAYPRARGMGSSASAIVAGLVAARALGDLGLSDRELAELAVEIEGHPDNVLPALLGGLVLAAGRGWMRFKPTPAVAPIVLVARERFATSQSRRVLPATVSRADAVANAGATAALVAVLGGLTGVASPAALMTATADRLHEPYRLPLLVETLELHSKLRAAGVAAALAGAGPSLVCLVAAADFDDVLALAQGLLPSGWAALAPGWDLDGAWAG